MQYASVIRGQFCSRPNRFLAVIRIGGQEEIVHVKNTGRCRELLIPGCTVYLSSSDNPNRKTKYDLIAVEKQREGKPPLLINLDSQIPNAAAAEWLETGSLFSANAVFRREVTHGNSRFDFSIMDGGIQSFLEVKGGTLELDGIALFPDAPSMLRFPRQRHSLPDRRIRRHCFWCIRSAARKSAPWRITWVLPPASCSTLCSHRKRNLSSAQKSALLKHCSTAVRKSSSIPCRQD